MQHPLFSHVKLLFDTAMTMTNDKQTMDFQRANIYQTAADHVRLERVGGGQYNVTFEKGPYGFELTGGPTSSATGQSGHFQLKVPADPTDEQMMDFLFEAKSLLLGPLRATADDFEKSMVGIVAKRKPWQIFSGEMLVQR